METLLKEEIGGRTLSVQADKLAKQASGSVVVQYGDTIVLVTVVAAHDERDSDFLPLTVEYQEKIYAAGRIPGNYFRREIGRPSDKETLTARLTDRPIRPLFADGFGREVQVIATVVSLNPDVDPDIPALIGASAALAISGMPFAGPVGRQRCTPRGGAPPKSRTPTSSSPPASSSVRAPLAFQFPKTLRPRRRPSRRPSSRRAKSGATGPSGGKTSGSAKRRK